MSNSINKQIRAWFMAPLVHGKIRLRQLTSMLIKVNKLNLINCYIDDVKMLYLAQALEGNRTLQNLEIYNNTFSSLGLEYLMKAINDNNILSVIAMDLLTGDELQSQFNILMHYNNKFNKQVFKKKNNTDSKNSNIKIIIIRNEEQFANHNIKENIIKELPLLPFHRNLPLCPLIGSYLLKLKKTDNDNKHSLKNAIYQLTMHHEALRVKLSKNEHGQWRQIISSLSQESIIRHLYLDNLTKHECDELIISCEQGMVKTIEKNLIAMMAAFFDWKNSQYLLIMFNHHHFDIRSQRIFFKDLEIACKENLPNREVSYCEAVETLHMLAKRDMKEELSFWQSQVVQTQFLPKVFRYTGKISDINQNELTKSTITKMEQDLDEASLKLKELFTIANIQVDEILLTAWVQVLHRWLKMPKFVINIINHGRGTIEDEMGFLENVIGCFVSFYPICFYLPSNVKGKQAVTHIKSLLEKAPHKGMRYGLLRYGLPELLTLWNSLPIPYLFFHFQIATSGGADSEYWKMIKGKVFNSLHLPDRLEPIWTWDQQQGKFYCAILHGASYSSEIIKELLVEYYKQIGELVNQLMEQEKIASQTISLNQTKKISAAYLSPRNIVEQKLAEIWSQLLYKERVGIHDNFFLLGGGSLQIVRLVAKIKEVFNRSVSVANCFKFPTIAEQAKFCAPGLSNVPIDPLLPIQICQGTVPLFLVHPIEGNAFPYLNLNNYLQGNTIYGLSTPRFTEPENPFASIEEMAAYYVEIIKTIHPQGPYNLGGWSFGGTVALEMAQQLQAQGQVINLLILIDTLCYTPLTSAQQSKANKHSKHSNELPEVEKYIISCANNHWNIQQAYRPIKYKGRVILIKARDLDAKVIENIYDGKIPNHLLDVYGGWTNLIEDLEIYSVPGCHGNLLTETKNIKAVAKVIKEGLDTIDDHPLLNKKLPLAQRLLSFAKLRKDKYLANALLNASNKNNTISDRLFIAKEKNINDR